MSIPPYNLPVRQILNQFGYLFPNWSNVTPFTYQDGQTAAKLLESLIAYIDKTLVPFVDDEMNAVILSWEETVEALVDAITDNAIVLQDSALAGILANVNSASRIFLETLLSNILTPRAGNAGEWVIRGAVGQTWYPVSVNAAGDFPTRIETILAGKFMGKTAAYTKAESDAKYPLLTNSYDKTLLFTKTESDARFMSDARGDTAEADIDALEALTTGAGRLSLASMDADYTRIIKNQHAVFIGSSNSAAGYGWTQTLCARRGWIHHNYSIGGGAFVPLDGVNNFKQQATTAIADNSFAKADVRWVFITDMSNDIRGLNNVESAALQVISQLRAAYPNARIIVVPAVWTFVNDNRNDREKRFGVRRRFEEVKRAGYAYRAEVIPDTWLWFWDSRNWLEGIPPNFHLSGAGYTKLIDYIERYLDGKDYDNGIEWTRATPIITEATLASYIQVSRSRGIVTISGNMQTYGSVAVDTVLARMPAGTAPPQQMVVEITNTDRERNALYINDDPSNGDIMTMTTLPGAKSFFFQTSYAVL